MTQSHHIGRIPMIALHSRYFFGIQPLKSHTMSITKVALLLLDDYTTSEGLDFADLGQSLIQSSTTSKTVEFTKFNYVGNSSNLPTNPADFDIIYLTGSRKDSYEDNEFNNTLIIYLQRAISTPKVKLLGICFGHQIIARSLNLTTKPNELGWEMGNTLVKTTGVNIPSSFVISEMHRDIVVVSENDKIKLENDGITVFGNTQRCTVQGLYKYGRLLTFQGHPEFSSGLTMKMITDRHERGIISDEFYNDASFRNRELHEDGTDTNGDLKLQKWIYEFIFEH